MLIDEPLEYTIKLNKKQNILLISFNGTIIEGKYNFIIQLSQDLETIPFEISRPLIVILDLDNVACYGDAVWTMGAKVYFRCIEIMDSQSSGNFPEMYVFSDKKEVREKWQLAMKKVFPVFKSIKEIEKCLKFSSFPPVSVKCRRFFS